MKLIERLMLSTVFLLGLVLMTQAEAVAQTATPTATFTSTATPTSTSTLTTPQVTGTAVAAARQTARTIILKKEQANTKAYVGPGVTRVP